MRWNPTNRFLRAPEGGEGGAGGGAGEGGAGDAKPGNSIITDNAPPGGGEKPWYDSLPPELKTHQYVASSKDLPSFVKSAVDTKSMVGANVIKLPGEKAAPEERAEFYKKLGRPDDLKGYESTVKPIADHIVDQGVQDKMRGVFLEAGLSKQQGQAILDAYTGVLNEGYTKHIETAAARHQEGVTALKGEWGAEFDNNVKTAQLAVRELSGSNELMTKIADAGLGSDPVMLKFLHAVGVKLLDDSAIGGQGGQGAFSATSEGAQAEINRLKTDTEYMEAWGNARHPGHAAAVERWTDLHKKAYPGKQSDQE